MMNASTIMSILGIILLILIVLILISCIKIVHQAQAPVVERLGAYQATWALESILRFRSLSVWQDGLI